MRFSFKVTDLGFDRLRQAIATIKQADAYTKVGVLASTSKGSKDRGALNLAEIAAVHEFGSRDGTIPERSFIRATLSGKQSELAAILKPLLTQLYEGKITTRRVLEILGAFLAAEVQKAITAGLSPPTKKVRVVSSKGGRIRGIGGRFLSRKGGSKPLIDTGQLLQAISYEVVL